MLDDRNLSRLDAVKRVAGSLLLIAGGSVAIRVAAFSGGPASEGLMLIGGATLFAGGVFGLVTLGRFMLGPLDEAARGLMRPTQFTIADFLSLIFLLQLPTAILHALVARGEPSMLRVLDCFAWIICGLMWALSVRTLSRAGITRPRHRLVFLALVLPVAYFGTLVFVALTTTVFISLVDRHLRKELGGLQIAFMGTTAALAVAFDLSAQFVRRMVAASRATPVPQSADRSRPYTPGGRPD